MTLNSTTKLSIAELAIYIVLLQPTLWLLYKHGRSGLMSFLYLIAFEILRVAAAGIQIANRNAAHPTESGAIVSSIGLSPLLLALAGFVDLLWLYYGAVDRSPLRARITAWGVHIGAVAGIALVAVGAAKLFGQNATRPDITTGYTMLKVGALILLSTWMALTFVYLPLFGKLNSQPVLGVLMGLSASFIGVRAVYSVVYAFDHTESLSPFTGSFVVRLVLIFLVQLLAALSLVAVAFLTRNAGKKRAAGHRTRHQNGEDQDSSIPLTARGYK
ncbi:hypothetical protein G647_01843 [Cladophialophora carrionii CBS 160.54]|uniref:DUF7702 domain-containing protein n=1 Tax=Cladophialophora carrionii CBS 160.54 TaxID=1279043 RepID=V9DR64_9EURO|nr:uncharacterized protein G647_01843 [Cladophialophora carrionii CBS 160.54]ETI29390.1 hypothetical protein G647_01843 [Cladophialophora carrionii CBS 160.54]